MLMGKQHGISKSCSLESSYWFSIAYSLGLLRNHRPFVQFENKLGYVCMLRKTAEGICDGEKRVCVHWLAEELIYCFVCILCTYEIEVQDIQRHLRHKNIDIELK